MTKHIKKINNSTAQEAQFSDEDLFLAIKEGSETAFAEIYHRYWDKLYFIAVKKIRQFEDGENLVQEVFLDLWNRRASLEIKSSLGAYLVAAIKYRIINYLAKQDRYEEYQNYLLNTKTAETSTENWLSFEELRLWLEGQIGSLPEKCRLVYQMREEGYTHKEIASQMHISEKTVENHITRALKSIKTSLSHYISLFFL